MRHITTLGDPPCPSMTPLTLTLVQLLLLPSLSVSVVVTSLKITTVLKMWFLEGARLKILMTRMVVKNYFNYFADFYPMGG